MVEFEQINSGMNASLATISENIGPYKGEQEADDIEKGCPEQGRPLIF